MSPIPEPSTTSNMNGNQDDQDPNPQPQNEPVPQDPIILALQRPKRNIMLLVVLFPISFHSLPISFY